MMSIKNWPTVILFALAFLLAEKRCEAQDSSRLRVSLLTCAPGEELYSTFGHSAMRVIDSNAVSDLTYNYGTFDFNDPDFYSKFVRGKLKYFVSVEETPDFIYNYQVEQRGVTEQVLNLSADEKQTLRVALNENLKEENKYYFYDFFLDNCTTRLRDLLRKNTTPVPDFPAVMPLNATFRNAIHLYLDSNHKDWSKLGIDLLLGAPTDAVMTVDQQAFLPDNLMFSMDSAKQVRLVESKAQLYIPAAGLRKNNWFTPALCFYIVLFVFLGLGIFSEKNKSLRHLLSTLDALLFFICGALGCLFIFMMVGTDHSMTRWNYNVLWAIPTHVVFAFLLVRRNQSAKKYFQATAVLMLLLLLLWFALPQQMNNALLPVVLLLMYRAAAFGFRKTKLETDKDVNLNL